MSTNTIHINIAIADSVIAMPILGQSSESIRNQLTELGVEFLLLICDDIGDYLLCVEDDVEFMLDAYFYLEELHANKGKGVRGEHHLALNDARLLIDCYWGGFEASVSVKFLKSPLGEVSSRMNFAITNTIYVGTWRLLIKALIDAMEAIKNGAS